MKKILITGAGGMLGSSCMDVLSESYLCVGLERSRGDISNWEQISKTILEHKPNIILNCAAYTHVDDAEDIGMQDNFQVNSLGVYHLAKIAAQQNIDFITISSDYVFDGNHAEGYREGDIPSHPINHYGQAKHLGEQLAVREYPESIIVRTSWLYGGNKDQKNFVNTMRSLAQTRDEISVVNDQFGSPTYALDLALGIKSIIEDIEIHRAKIFHLSNTTADSGISWYSFAREVFILGQQNIKVIPCSSEAFPTKALRPKHSRLINNSDIKLPDWQDALKRYIDTLQ